MPAVSRGRPKAPPDPVYLPEFGTAISWAMCRNPACASFGIKYTGPSSPGRLDLTTNRFHCKTCAMSFELKANLAVRAIARYFLPLSLPYAGCSNPECANYSCNVFESYSPAGMSPPAPPHPGEEAKGKRRRPYRKMGEHRVYCRECGADGERKAPHAFMLGTSLSAKGRHSAKKDILELLRGIDEQRSITGTVNRTRMGVSSYYARLHRVSERLRDYSSWRNAAMLKPNFWPRDGVARIYTDDFVVSLQRLGEGPRYHALPITVSVIGLENTYYVLAAHPHYLPKEWCPDPGELGPEKRLPPWATQWDCLWHEFRPGAQSGETPAPDSGLRGRFIHEHYAQIAHFLVIRKMLARCPRLHVYMDGAKPLLAAALTAFADDIRGGRVEIVSFQHKGKLKDQPEASGKSYVARDEKGLRRAWNAWEKQVSGQIDPSGELDLSQGKVPDPRVLARAWKKAMVGAYSKPGSWAWLKWPPGGKHYRNPRSLWVTWAPGKTFDDGKDLLAHATLQPVDSADNMLRHRARGARRALFRSKGDRSYLESYFHPRVVCAEIWITILLFNFSSPYKRRFRDSVPLPVEALGLARPNELTVEVPETSVRKGRKRRANKRKEKRDGVSRFADVAWTFRLGVTHAERMTRWLR